MRNCAEILHATNFNRTLSLFRKKETVQYLSNAFYTKVMLSQSLELLRKMFPTILDMKSATKVQKSFFKATLKTQ